MLFPDRSGFSVKISLLKYGQRLDQERRFSPGKTLPSNTTIAVWTCADLKKRVSLPPQVQVQTSNPTVRSLSPFNKTILPDSFLLTFRPTFLVRHPALAFPSYYRAHTDSRSGPKNQLEEHDLIRELTPWMTFHWMRWLYEFYGEQRGFQIQIHRRKLPIILDADDIISSRSIIIHYAWLIGLDPTKLRLDWEPASREELSKISVIRGRSFVSTISVSCGVVKGKTAEGLDLVVEVRKWKEEFGEVIGGKMEEWVKGAMDDYEFFKERKLRPKDS
jgi:hypothetical protein